MDDLNLDPQRQKQAKEYAKISRRFLLLDIILGTTLLLAWLFFGWSISLRDWILGWTTNPWLAVLVFGFVFGSVFTLVDLPLSFYTGYILPHRFEQSNQDLRGWISDLLKGLAISAIMGAVVLELIYLLLRTSPIYWWLWTGGFMLLFSVIIANLAPILLFPIFNTFSPLEDGYQDLQQRLLVLAEKAGITVMGVYSFDMSRRTKSANAGLTGLGSTRRIILGDTLLEEYSEDEIETILAHELGHHVNKDIPIGMVFQSILTLGGLYLASRGIVWAISFFDFYSIGDIAAFPILGLILGVYGLLTTPISNAFSRWREIRADLFALQITGKGSAYANALTKLSDQNLAEVDPEPWVEFLLYSHPALNRRIKMARSYQP